MASSARQAPNRRDEILEAAGAIIARKGVRGLRVEEVAAEARVATSLIYYHFGDRSGLLQAAMERTDEVAPSWELRTPDPTRDAYTRLRDVLLKELGPSAGVKQNVIVWNEMTASAVFDADLQPRVARTTREWTGLIAKQIRAGQKDGTIRSDIDPHDESEIIACLLDGLCSHWLTSSVSRSRARELLATVIRDRLAARAR